MIIESRHNGPPDSGNGGHCAGRFAGALVGAATPSRPVEVTLRRPPPLSVPLTLADGQVRDPAGQVVADVAATTPFDATVPPVSWAEAERASLRYAGFTHHPFPTCYVCGPLRDDGLRIFPGPMPDGRTAAGLVVPADVGPETVWAALDCPGGWAVLGAGRPYVLGRIAVAIEALPRPTDRCVVTGTAVSTEGRKALVHSTLYGPDGSRLAYARATWIALR